MGKVSHDGELFMMILVMLFMFMMLILLMMLMISMMSMMLAGVKSVHNDDVHDAYGADDVYDGFDVAGRTTEDDEMPRLTAGRVKPEGCFGLDTT